MQAAKAPGRGRILLAIGVVLIVIGAGLMDQAGRTQSALWWNLSGGFAFVGFLLAVASLAVTEGWLRRLPRGMGR